MMRRFFHLFWLHLAVLALLSVGARAATPPVSAETYRAQLQDAGAKLERMEETPGRPLRDLLRSLAKAQTVRRADGAVQNAGADEWIRRAADANNVATRRQVRAARQAVEHRLRALDEWASGAYQAADAQAIVRQLEATGQIRTGPTAVQQAWNNVRQWLGNLWDGFVRWINSLFPAPRASTAPTPHINFKLIWALFVLTVVALLALLGFLAWRALGGRWGKEGARRKVQFIGGEDAELLRLPPDELGDRAAQFAREGNFREALRHLYIATLLRLDARGVWHYDARRTNWEHIAGLRRDPARVALVPPLSDLTRRFDRVRYGNAGCTREDWTTFERDAQSLIQTQS